MSRSGYSDDVDDNWTLIKWRGQVASATRGKRGQAFFREMVAALDAMPEKRLIAHDLVSRAPAFIPPQYIGVCAIGCVGMARGLDLSGVDPDRPDAVAAAVGVAYQLAAEIEHMNDEIGDYRETPEHRWSRMRKWAAAQIIKENEPA